MRDYDPTTGRYIQADPLGLIDGASLYGYALQSPGRHTDPRGECVGPLAYACAAAAGAALGAAIDFLIQVYQNGGLLDCIDWGRVGFNAGTGAIGGVGFKAAGAAYGIYAGGRGATAAGFGYDLLNWGPSNAFEYGMTCHEIFPPVTTRVRPKEGMDDEANDTKRRTDHWYPA